jgi:hypothetical protein
LKSQGLRDSLKTHFFNASFHLSAILTRGKGGEEWTFSKIENVEGLVVGLDLR